MKSDLGQVWPYLGSDEVKSGLGLATGSDKLDDAKSSPDVNAYSILQQDTLLGLIVWPRSGKHWINLVLIMLDLSHVWPY